MRRPGLITAAALAALVLLGADPVSADGRSTRGIVAAPTAGDHSASIALIYHAGRTTEAAIPPSKAARSGEPWRCYYFDYSDTKEVIRNEDGSYTNVDGGEARPQIAPNLAPEAGNKYVFMCYADGEQKIHAPDGGYLVVTYDPARPAAPLYQSDPGVELTQLIAEGRVRPEAPVIATSPDRSMLQMIGLPTWFWIDQGADPDWQDKSIEVPLPAAGIQARLIVTAKPSGTLTVTPGDGTKAFSCDGPGVPYAGQDDRASACAHAYQHVSGPDGYTAQVVVNYAVRWEATGFPGGELPDIASLPAEITLRTKGTQAVGR